MGAAALPFLLAAGSAGVGYINDRNYNKKQDKIVAQGIRQKDARQHEADKRVQQTIDETAASNPQDEIGSAMQRYQQSLKAGAPQANASFGTTGGSAYQADANNAALGVQDYAKTVAGLFSRIDGAGQQRAGEARSVADTGADVDLISRFAQGDDYLNRLKLASVRKNPWMSALSAGLKGASMVTGSGGGDGLFSSLFGKGFENGTGIYEGMT